MYFIIEEKTTQATKIRKEEAIIGRAKAVFYWPAEKKYHVQSLWLFCDIGYAEDNVMKRHLCGCHSFSLPTQRLFLNCTATLARKDWSPGEYPAPHWIVLPPPPPPPLPSPKLPPTPNVPPFCGDPPTHVFPPLPC